MVSNINEIKEVTKLSEKKILRLEEYKLDDVTSLNSPVKFDEETELGDVLASNTESFENVFCEDVSRQNMMNAVKVILKIYDFFFAINNSKMLTKYN